MAHHPSRGRLSRKFEALGNEVKKLFKHLGIGLYPLATAPPLAQDLDEEPQFSWR
jgi:hypothetical protein